MRQITRVSKEFTKLRKESRRAKQISIDCYLESIGAERLSLIREITRKSAIVL